MNDFVRQGKFYFLLHLKLTSTYYILLK